MRRSGQADPQTLDGAQKVAAVLGYLHPGGKLFEHAHLAAGESWTALAETGCQVLLQQREMAGVVGPENVSAEVGPQPEGEAEVGVFGSGQVW